MPSYNETRREINYRVVYCGPPWAGKTSNLSFLCSNLDQHGHGKLMSIETSADRVLFCSVVPSTAARVGGYTVRVHLYTIPGRSRHNQTHKMVLRGVDGVVFVASSEMVRRPDNLESFSAMLENLRRNDLDPNEMPIVLQYNKRDLVEIDTLDELNRNLNAAGRVWKAAVASLGVGVMETMNLMISLLVERTLTQGIQTVKSATPAPQVTRDSQVRSGPTPGRPARRTPGPLDDVPTVTGLDPGPLDNIPTPSAESPGQLLKVLTPAPRRTGPLQNVLTPGRGSSGPPRKVITLASRTPGSLRREPSTSRSVGSLRREPSTPRSVGPLRRESSTPRSVGPLRREPSTPRSVGPLEEIPTPVE